MSRRIQDLLQENAALKARVNELEANWKKIEKAWSSNVTRARRTVRRTAKRAARKVAQVVSAAT